MTPVTFTHASYDTEVIVYAEQVFAVTFLPTQKSTVILGPGNAGVPVKGTVDEVSKKLEQAIQPANRKQATNQTEGGLEHGA
jgi:hypothetical protein